MTAADLPAALYVRKYAFESVLRAEGREPPPWNPAVDHSQLHILTTDPAGSFIAEIDGLVVGFSQGFVRGDIWFLAQLFVHPEVHARGIGRELLRQAMQYGRDAGCSVISVVSTSSPVAQSLYMRAGMFTFGVGYRLTGTVASLLDLPKPDATKEAIVDCSGWQDRIADIDRDLFGAERRQDHSCYLDPTHRSDPSGSFGLTHDGRLVGYGYAVAPGFIAPVAAYDPADQLPLVRMCAEYLHQRGTEDASLWVISHNQVLMTALLTRGWKITNWSFLKANRPFANFDRYHPAGGILL